MDSRAVRTFRVFVVVTAIVAVVLGVVAIVWPRPSLVVVALLFGVYLVVRRCPPSVRRRARPRDPGGVAVDVGIVGGLVGVAGLVTLLDPAVPLLVYAVLAGVGFVVEGIASLVGAFVGHPGSSRIPSVVSGVLSILGGVVVLVAPAWR